MAEIAAQSAAQVQDQPTIAKCRIIRNIGFSTVFLLSVSSIGLCFSGIIPFSSLAGLYPGSSLIGIMLVMLAVSTLLAVIYAMIGSVVPHYAADYRLASRVVSPSLAFASSFASVAILSIFSGSLIASIFRDTVPAFLRILAMLLNEKGLLNQIATVSGPYEVTLSATVLLIIVFIFLIFPPKVTRRVLLVSFLLSILGWLLIYFQLLSGNSAHFPAAWDQYMGAGTHVQRINDATQAGMQVDNGIQNVLSAGLLFAMVVFYGYFNPVSVAAEIKKPFQDLLKGSLAALLTAFVLFAAAVWLLNRLVPLEWIASESFLHQSTAFSGVTMPWLPFYAAIIQPNPMITWLVGIIWMFSILTMAHALLFTCSRVILAWVEDHILPAEVGFLHPQLRSPLIPVLLVCMLAEIGIVDLAINGSPFARFNLVLFWIGALILPILGLTLLPFRKPEWLLSSPKLVRGRIGIAPVPTVLGVLGLIYLATTITLNFTMQKMSGNVLPTLAVFTVIFMIGLGWFFGRRKYLPTLGVSAEQALQELPQE